MHLDKKDEIRMSLSTRSKVIVAIQIAGTAYAAMSLLVGFPGLAAGAVTLLFFCILLTLSVFGFVSGLLFWSGSSSGYYGSIITHALQIPLFFSSLLAYKLAFGIGFFVKIVGPIKLFRLDFGSSQILIVVPADQSLTLAVNLYAVFALAYLVRDRNLLTDERASANP